MSQVYNHTFDNRGELNGIEAQWLLEFVDSLKTELAEARRERDEARQQRDRTIAAAANVRTVFYGSYPSPDTQPLGGAR